MINVREEIQAIGELGRLPAEQNTDFELLKKFDELHRKIIPPVTDQEARILIKVFDKDGCFGIASSIMHLIETAPGWPLEDCLTDLENEWILEMKERSLRKRHVSPISE